MLRPGQSHRESPTRRTAPGLAFDSEGTAVLLYASPRQSETDSGPLSGCVSRIKGLVYKRLLGARAIIRDLDQELRPVFGEPRTQP